MTATPSDGGSEGTWAKLRRRKVVQWGLTYRKALELAPGFLAGRAFLGKTLLVAGQPEAALALIILAASASETSGGFDSWK